MKDRRTRVRKAQRKWTDKEKMIVPIGCSQAAWDGIYKDIFDGKKISKVSTVQRGPGSALLKYCKYTRGCTQGVLFRTSMYKMYIQETYYY